MGVLLLPCLASAATEDDPLFVNDEIIEVDPRFPPRTYPPGHVLDNTVPWLTQVVAFDPNHEFTPEEQAKVIESELILNDARRSPLDSDDGMALLMINQGTIPEALTRTPLRLDMLIPPVDPGQEEINICPRSQQYIVNSAYSTGDRFGNDLFGAAYNIAAHLRVERVLGGTKFDSRAEGVVSATAFSARRDIVRAYAYLTTTPTTGNGEAAIFLMGNAAWSQNFASQRSHTKKIDRHFFRSQKVFMVGPVPVRVTASLDGHASMNVTANWGTLGSSLSATPKGAVDANASAGVDVGIAAMGISGNLRLIEVSFPVTSQITVNNFNQLPWGIKVNREIKTLNGRISLYAIVRFIFFSKRWDLTIASWSGFTSSTNLFTANGTPSLSTATVSLLEP
ncbi:hypothetical protein POL68_01625 [Stigmatella sp. ncwal1]|uniref:Uncharacterized protein n=1 Tax=Stigmatella ashevillensis TaxID=2995309 RepID=A0ABT5D0F5_9BACT|nr:hypothetical protein [Stigmatella ashevillena]MDC0707157.1 hypothetical protein [Stigmatella ashevillena]